MITIVELGCFYLKPINCYVGFRKPNQSNEFKLGQTINQYIGGQFLLSDLNRCGKPNRQHNFMIHELAAYNKLLWATRTHTCDRLELCMVRFLGIIGETLH